MKQCKSMSKFYSIILQSLWDLKAVRIPFFYILLYFFPETMSKGQLKWNEDVILRSAWGEILRNATGEKGNILKKS